MASLSYKLAYLEAIRVWLKYKNYKGDKRKRIYLLLQERADSARDLLWNIKEFPNFLKISKLYEDEDITTYEDMVKRIFGKLEGTTEHDNAYYRARIAAIRSHTHTQDVQVQKWLGCGYIPERLREDFNIFIKQALRNDNSPLTFTELMTYNTWYELHPEKVAGTMVGSSSFYFPVLVKGTKKDVENMFKAALKKDEVYKEGETYFSADNEIYFTILAVGNGKLLIQPSTTKKPSWLPVASIDKLVEKGWHSDNNGKTSSDKPTQEQKPEDDKLKLLQKFFRGSGKKVRVNDNPPAIGESPIHEYRYSTGYACADVRYQTWSEGNGWDYLDVCFVFDDGTVKVQCDALPEYKEFIASKKEGKPTPKYKVGDKFTDKGGSVFTITEIRSYNELNDYEKSIAKKKKAQFFYYLNDGHQTVACWDANIEDLFEPIKDEDDNDDELEMLELEAEALALELELGSDSVSGIDDMEFYFNESEDVAIVEGVSEEDYDDALALVKKELDARLGKNRYRLWSDWHIGDKWNFIIKRK